MSRHNQVHTTRLESLSDTVFGFSIALLIVSVEVPSDFASLLEIIKGFTGFALSFAMIILVWVYHYHYFRDYKLEDNTTILLNSILLFVVLFYVFPLKYVVAVITTMMGGEFPVTIDEVAILMAIYSAGFAAVFAVFGLMYLHANRQRAILDLSAEQTITTQEQISNCLIMTGVGLFSVALALVLPSPWAGPIAGTCYFLIGPMQYINTRRYAQKRSSLGRNKTATPDSNKAEPGA